MTEADSTTVSDPVTEIPVVFESISAFRTSALLVAPLAGATLMPTLLLVINTLCKATRVAGEPAVPCRLTPAVAKFLMVELRIVTCPRPFIRTPLRPGPLPGLRPSKSKPSRTTLSVAPAINGDRLGDRQSRPDRARARLPFRIINIYEVVGASMGLHHDDRFKRLKIMQDADAILADCRDLVEQHGLDPETTRQAIQAMLDEQPVPLRGG